MNASTVRSVCVEGRGYLALTVALWLRRLSPRLAIVLEQPASPVISPRYLCGLLRGRREGVRFSGRLIRDLVYPSSMRDCACSVRVVVKEPQLPLSLLGDLKGERRVSLPPSPLGVQLALCADSRERRVLAGDRLEFFASSELSSALADMIASAGILSREESAELLSELSVEPEIIIERVEGSTVRLSGRAFLDEAVESLAAAAALEVVGRRYAPAPSLIAIDAGEDVFFEVGEQRGESSVKMGFGGSAHFVRLVLSREEMRVVGARGVVPRWRFPAVLEAVLVLLSREGLCEHLPTFAAARSTMLSDCSVLRGLLSLSVKTCLRSEASQ